MWRPLLFAILSASVFSPSSADRDFWRRLLASGAPKVAHSGISVSELQLLSKDESVEVPTPAPVAKKTPVFKQQHGRPKTEATWVTKLKAQVAAVSKQRFMIGGRVYKYGDLNETDGTFYAATHLHRDIEKGFFCPVKLYGGTATIKTGTTFQVADETIIRDPLGAQACCLLDKTYQLLDTISMLRSCQTFKTGTELNHEAIRQTTAGDQDQVKEFQGGFNTCNAGAISSAFWHMRACCVDKVFFFDHSERTCMKELRGVMKNLVVAKKNMNKCVNEGGAKNVNMCTLTEESLILSINDLNAAAFNLIHTGAAGSMTDAAKELISISDGTAEGTLKGIDLYLQTHKRTSGDFGLPSLGAACEGC